MQKRMGTPSRALFFFTLLLALSLPLCILNPVVPGTGIAEAVSPPNWEFQNHFHDFFHDICAIDADNAWAVADGGTIVRTHDGGDTWIDQDSGATTSIYGVSACDTYTAWAIGYNMNPESIILHSDDGGDSWMNQLLFEESQLFDVAAVDPLTAWVVGDGGIILRTEDAGESWEPQESGVTVSLHGITAYDGEIAWVAGEGGLILKTDDGGGSWEPQVSSTTENLLTIDAIDASTIWAAGDSGTILKTTNGGSSWNPQDSGTTYNFTGLSAADAQAAWVVGNDVNRGKILKTSNGGISWAIQDTIHYEASGVAAVDPLNAWVVGGDLDILRTYDGGMTWIDQWPGTTSVLTDICATDPNTAWVARGIADVLKTEDGGLTWVSQDTGPDYPDLGSNFALSALDENTAWVVGRAGAILKTEDGGANWIPQNSGVTESLYGISCVDEQTAWAVGSPHAIIKTTDGGDNWEQQDPGTSFSILDVSAANADVAWAVRENDYSSFDPILKTVNGGEEWFSQDISFPSPVASIHAVDVDTAWAAEYSGIVYRTTNGGDNWDALLNLDSLSPNLVIRDIYALDAYTAWAVGYIDSPDWSYAVYRTNDGGSTWHPQMPLYWPGQIEAISAVDACNVWAVGVSGTILHTANGGDTRPDILTVSPDSGTVGSQVTITGCDFGESRESSQVFFGETPAENYISWADTEIVVEAPAAPPGESLITVTTSEGTSNPAVYSLSPLSVQSITPNQIMQNTWSLDVEVAGTGFQPGATVRLERGTAVNQAYNVNVVSETGITCTLGFLGAESGTYDVVVLNPGGDEARLEDAFTVTPMCGQGSGAGLLMFGLTLGLLSLAGTTRLRRRKK